MWKRLRPGRKNETDKAPGSSNTPTRPDPNQVQAAETGGGSGTGEVGHGTESEGFLCPMCMKGFKSPEDLQWHFENVHDDTPQLADKEPSQQESTNGFVCPICMNVLATAPELQLHFDQMHDQPDISFPDKETSGFICPQCKQGHPSAEALQEHFLKVHENTSSEISANRDGDVLALRQEVDDLRTTLKEEKWYSTELKKEVDKLQASGGSRNHSNSAGLTDEEKVELDLHRQQLKASEESRVLLSSEVVHLRDRLEDAKIENQRLHEAKSMIEQKAAKLSGGIVAAKARADEIEGQRVGFENHIKTLTEQLAERNRYTSGLESQLAQRPGADDVLVLRQELVHAQTLMDQLTQDQENEKAIIAGEHATLKDEHQRANERIQELQDRLQSLPRVEEMTALKSSLTDFSSERGGLIINIGEKEAIIKEREVQCSQLKEALQEQVALLQTKEVLIQEMQKGMEERDKTMTEKKAELKRMDAEIVALKEATARFEERSKMMDGQSTERAGMIEKIQLEKSQVDTRNRSLETDKLSLEKDLEAARLAVSQKEAELKDISTARAELQTLLEKRENKITEKEADIERLQNTLAELRQSTQSTEYEKEQQITNIKIDLEKTENKLKDRETTITNLEKQLLEINNRLQNEITSKEEIQTLLSVKESELAAECRKVEHRDNKIKESETQITNIKENVSRLENERTDLLAKIEAGDGVATAINQLTVEKASLQEKLSVVENLNQKQASENQEKVDGLHKQIQDLKTQLQRVEESKSKLEGNLTSAQEKLEEATVKITSLNGELNTKGEVLLATETSKEAQRADLENHIKTIQNSQDEKVREMEATKTQLETTKQELAEQTEKGNNLGMTLQDQTARANQLEQKVVSLEADIKGRDTNIERLETSMAALKTDLEGQISTAQTQWSETHANREKISDQLRESKTDCQRLQGEIIEAQEKLKDVGTARNKAEAELSKKVEELKRLGQSKKSTDSQLLLAQETINEKTSQLEKTQSALESEVAKLKSQYSKACDDATSIQKQLKEQIESLEESLNVVMEEKSDLEKELSESTKSHTATGKILEETEAKLRNEQTSMADAANAHSEKVETMEEEIRSLKLRLDEEKNTLSEKEAELQSKITLLDGVKGDTEKKLQETEKTLLNKENEGKQMQDALSKLKKEWTVREKDLTKQVEEAMEKDSILSKDLQMSKEQCGLLEEELIAQKTKISSLEDEQRKTISDYETKLQAMQDKDSTHQKSLSSLKEDKTSLSMTITELEKSLENVKSKRDELQINKNTLEQTLIDQQKLYHDVLEGKNSLERELSITKADAEKKLNERNMEVAEKEEARAVLIKQKLELQTQVTNLGNTLAALRSEYDESRETAAGIEQHLRAEKDALHATTENVQGETKKLHQQMEELNLQHEMQLSALTENLTVMRTELMSAQEKLVDSERSCNEVRGEKLELEAKLGNNNDERRVLLERCLSSEAEVQKLQEKVTEVRRKLDDTQAALHELGRENQSLQISSNKAQGRKWADDSLVSNCLSCKKAFSMTVRKHHCRNCGNIYCNECSAKTAPVAASKKPVRVCDTCYGEIQDK